MEKRQVKTERGTICVVAEFKSSEEAMEHGFYYSFHSTDLNCHVFSKCLDDLGHHHQFALVR
ncbi:MAG: hypothetical protein K6G88_11765 [Lachnospiraceae bacterium]|nr:hypothetical protein [Lachnospiraceae bacterium]